MASKGAKSSSVDFSYLSDGKLEKGKKKVKEAAETTWKGGSSKERKEEAAAEKVQKAIKKRSPQREEKVSMKKKIGGLAAVLFLCGVGLFQFLESVFGFIVGDGITYLDVHDTTKLKEVLFGGEPWLVYCVNNETLLQRLPKVLEDSARSVRSSIGLNVGVLSCWDQTQSGRSVAQRFKLRDKPPLTFLVANGNKPRTLNLAGVAKAEDIEKKAKPALTLDISRIDSLKRWPSHCTSRRTCVVIAHKQQVHRDSALSIMRPLMQSHRALRIVTLDTSFWSLKLDDNIIKRRPPQVKGSYRADVLCLSREEAAHGNATHRGDFLQELDHRSASSFLTACLKQDNLVKIGVPPRIKARPSKPKKVTATRPPPPPPRKAPSPPKPKDPRSSGGSSRDKVDSVGSRAKMEAAAAEDPLFEAVEAEDEEVADSEANENEQVEDEDVDSEGSENAEPSDEEVEL